jgi:hypothetical protein
LIRAAAGISIFRKSPISEAVIPVMSAKEKLSWSDERAAAGELGVVPSPFLRDDLAFDLVEGGRPEMRRVVKNRKECRPTSARRRPHERPRDWMRRGDL